MKKVFKKIISFLLALVLSIAFSVQALATDISSNERIIIRDNVIETPLTVEQAETYAIYEISLSQIPPQNQSQPQSDQSVVNSILSLCSLDKTVQVDSLIIKEYSSNMTVGTPSCKPNMFNCLSTIFCSGTLQSS